MKAENRGNEGFLQRESMEHQGYAEARSTDRSEGKERDGASDLLEAIPMIAADVGETVSHPAVIATSPAREPFRDMETSGFL